MSQESVYQSFFGPKFSGFHLPENWTSTGNAIERKAFLTKDAVMVVDDFVTRGTPNDVARSHSAAERLIRSQGNQAGRDRLNSQAQLKGAYHSRGLIIATGEDLPNGHSLQARMTPDWMPGAVSRCVPVEMKRNQHGERSTTIVVGTESVLSRGKWRTVEVLAYPVTFSPHQELIDSARHAYDDWWKALGWIRDGLIAGGMLREVEVTAAMPKWRPWKKG